MGGWERLGPLGAIGARLGRVRARTWVALGAGVLLVVGVVAAAGIAILVWLWGQAPAAIDAGKRLGGEAVAQVEQVTPGLKEELDRWLPGLRERWARWFPGAAPVPATDVSGVDIGPVPRYPGLVRSHFARDAQAVEVRYVGDADFAAVLAHYVQGIAGAGFTREVVAASADAETHRFARGGETFELALRRLGGGRVEVVLTQHLVERDAR